MSIDDIRHRHIPISRRALTARLAESPPGEVSAGQVDRLRAVFELLEATLHFRYHERLESMKTAYAPFNPDLDTSEACRSPAELTQSAQRLADELSEVLERANYRAVSPEEIERAFHEQALFRVSMEVDFDAFEELLIYARGRSRSTTTVNRGWLRRRRPLEVEIFDRVCVYVRLKGDDQLTARQVSELPCEPGTVLLKLFRNIPVADLEMLFPNCRVRLRTADKLLLGVPALVGGVPVVIKLAPALLSVGVLLGVSRGPTHHASTVAALMALLMLAGYLVRQWNVIKNRRVAFLKVLSENLYFRNLDNNEGVLTRLVDDAEEEASKEMILVFAVGQGVAQPLALDQTRAVVEAWLGDVVGRAVDFDVDRAVAGLVELGLATRDDEGGFSVVSAESALVELDRQWDAFFPYAAKPAV